ncbi:MAG TPA: aminotransferase class IV [Burkholderiaceae bacterium]|nr:aminotransferase class IV [Burkholderiaceae bacterium]
MQSILAHQSPRSRGLEPIVYVGGEYVIQSEAKVSVLDHGLLYGDGIFETVFAWRGRIFKLDEHLDRGERSMAAIGMAPPLPRSELRKVIIETVRRNGFRDAYVKWIVTRGVNGKPLMDPAGCVPNLIVLVQPYLSKASAERVADGLRLKTVAVRRPSGDVIDPKIKSLNYLNLVLAKMEAKSSGADEALLLDTRGCIAEATGCNIFLRHGRRLSTPRTGILMGITRETVMELAAARGYQVSEADLELYDAYTADEILICSTAGGLLPVVGIDGRTIGQGAPGRAFAELRNDYAALIESPEHGTPVFD